MTTIIVNSPKPINGVSSFEVTMDDEDFYKIQNRRLYVEGSDRVTRITYQSQERPSRVSPVTELFLGKREGFYIDHIDRNVLNCCKGNLRHVTPHESAANRGMRSDNSIGYIGVHWSKARKYFYAKYENRGKCYSKAKFTTALDAAIYYDSLVLKYSPISNPVTNKSLGKY